MKEVLCCLVVIGMAVCFSPGPICAQEASNFQEPGTGALKQVKTADQAAQDAGKPQEKQEEPSSAPLNASTGSAKQTVSQMTDRPEVAWVYRSDQDAPRSVFAKSIAERMQEGAVSNPPEDSAAAASSPGPMTEAELSMADIGSSTSLPVVVSPSVSVSPTSLAPTQGVAAQSVNASATDRPASQPATTSSPVYGFDQKTLDLLPSVVFAASVSGEGQTSSTTAMSAPKEVGAARPEGVRGAGTREEGARHLGQRGTAVEKLAGGMSKGGAAKSGLLLLDGQSSQTGWFDTLRNRAGGNNVSDMSGREAGSDQKCVSFADTDGIAKMIEKSSERAGLSEDHPKVLYAYGQDAGNIVFITVIQLDSSEQPKKAARLFADGRVQAFGQLARRDRSDAGFSGAPVHPNEVLFTKKGYKITGVLKSETISKFFLDRSRGAARGPCPKAFSKK